jgi:protein TonB
VRRIGPGILALSGLLITRCGDGARKPTVADESLCTISVEAAVSRQDPSAISPVVATLKRGTQIKAGAGKNGYVSVILPGGTKAWVPQGTFERASELVWRQERSRDVQGLTPQPGLTVERSTVFLAPDFGAAQWGELAAGIRVEVLLTQNDFIGIRLPGVPLGFVASRSIQFVPAAPTRGPEPEEEPEDESEKPVPVPVAPREIDLSPVEIPDIPPKPAVSSGPYETLPEGAERPVLKHEVRPRYPDVARRAGVQGMVILRVLVKKDGTVGSVVIIRDLPMGLGQIAADAVKQYEYEPARVQGVPVDAYLTTTVRFTLANP